MSRQDSNAAFARSSFLYGGNAGYIEELQARYEAKPQSVDADNTSISPIHFFQRPFGAHQSPLHP